MADRRYWRQVQYTVNGASDSYYDLLADLCPGDIILLGAHEYSGTPISHAAVVLGSTPDGPDLYIGQHGSLQPIRTLSDVLYEYLNYNNGDNIFVTFQIKDPW